MSWSNVTWLDTVISKSQIQIQHLLQHLIDSSCHSKMYCHLCKTLIPMIEIYQQMSVMSSNDPRLTRRLQIFRRFRIAQALLVSRNSSHIKLRMKDLGREYTIFVYIMHQWDALGFVQTLQTEYPFLIPKTPYRYERLTSVEKSFVQEWTTGRIPSMRTWAPVLVGARSWTPSPRSGW